MAYSPGTIRDHHDGWRQRKGLSGCEGIVRGHSYRYRKWGWEGREHRLYRTETPLPSMDLRPFGLEGEIKCAKSIVVAPGSINLDTGLTYRF